MPYDVTATMRDLESKLASAGYFKHVQVGEPKKAPDARFTAAIFMEEIGVAEVPLNSITGSYVITVRIYDNMTHEPQEDVELQMAIVVDKLMNDLAGDFDLGGNVRNVALVEMAAKWGYVEVDRLMYRIADVKVPLIINEVAMLG